MKKFARCGRDNFFKLRGIIDKYAFIFVTQLLHADLLYRSLASLLVCVTCFGVCSFDSLAVQCPLLLPKSTHLAVSGRLFGHPRLLLPRW